MVQSLLRRDAAADAGAPFLSTIRLGRDALRVWNVCFESLFHGVQRFPLPSLWLRERPEEKVVVIRKERRF